MSRLLFVGLWCVASVSLAEEPPADVTALETRWRAEDGSEVSLSRFKGRWYALTFVYTSCAGSCPLTTKKLIRLDRALVERGRPLDLVVVSLDPAHDTPEAVRSYRTRYGLLEAKRWSVLVGDEAQVRTLTMLLSFKYAKNPESGSISHDNTVYLINPMGTVRTSMSSLDQPLDAFLAALPPMPGKAARNSPAAR